jgi:hypothetical protein
MTRALQLLQGVLRIETPLFMACDLSLKSTYDCMRVAAVYVPRIDHLKD